MTCSTKTFIQCFLTQKELLLCGYSRLFNLSYEIPLDVVQTCYIFLPCTLIIPLIQNKMIKCNTSDSDSIDSFEEHLCEDEINDRMSLWEHELVGKYQFIKALRVNQYEVDERILGGNGFECP